MTRTRTYSLARTIAVVATAAAAMLVAVAPAQAVQKSGSDSVGFGVSPLRIDVDAKAGQTESQSITITNTDTTATKFTFAKEDYAGDQQDPAATPVLLGGKLESPISGYDWIQLPDPVTVPPGQSRTVKFNVKVPAGATGPHYAALMVTGEPRSADAVVATSRLGVLLLMNAGGAPPPELVITEVQEVGPDKTITRFLNTGGDQTTEVTGTLTEDPTGKDPSKITGECTQEVLPGAAGECVFDTSGSGSGDGTLIGDVGPTSRSVDILGTNADGEGTSARSELPTEWANGWTSLLLPLVGISLFVLYFLFLRRRRKNEEGDEDAGMAWAGPGAS
ncbi:MAG: hypothetical protein KDC46_05205 [Thermoleophilia bacterium]|nr:hypothetical protein [Thermoleophilia bacterium]